MEVIVEGGEFADDMFVWHRKRMRARRTWPSGTGPVVKKKRPRLEEQLPETPVPREEQLPEMAVPREEQLPETSVRREDDTEEDLDEQVPETPVCREDDNKEEEQKMEVIVEGESMYAFWGHRKRARARRTWPSGTGPVVKKKRARLEEQLETPVRREDDIKEDLDDKLTKELELFLRKFPEEVDELEKCPETEALTERTESEVEEEWSARDEKLIKELELFLRKSRETEEPTESEVKEEWSAMPSLVDVEPGEE